MKQKFLDLHQQYAWFTPLVILILTFLIVFYLLNSKPVPPKQPTLEKEWLVSTEVALFKLATPQINLLGRVQSPFDSTMSAGITADIAHVTAREGMRVKEDDLLIQLDDKEITLVVAQKQADVNELKAQIQSEINRYAADQKALKEEQQLLSIAENGVKRQETLKASKLAAQERYDAAESQRAQTALAVNARQLQLADHQQRLTQLKARLLRAEALLNDALLDLERTQVKAPFDGVITQVNVAPGERIQVGQALLSLYDHQNMEVHAQIPDRHVNTIRQALASGQTLKANMQHFGEQIELSLQRMSGEVKTGSGGINALFSPTNPDSTLILNSAVEILLNLPAIENAISLPLSAIYDSDRVYRVEEGRLQAISIDILGKEFDLEGKQDRAIVSSRLLNSGDIIAITQLPNAISGLKVKARE